MKVYRLVEVKLTVMKHNQTRPQRQTHITRFPGNPDHARI